MTRLPSAVVRYVCHTPIAPDTSVIETLAPTSRLSRLSLGPAVDPSASCGNSASSKIVCVRNGTITPSADEPMMATAMSTTRPRYGRN